MSGTQESLVGVWKLVSYAHEQEGHEETFPFGLAPEGFLIYTSDGYVSAQLMKPGRPQFESHEWQAGTPDEYQQAGSGYIGYCGVYEVDEEEKTVTHVPSVALVPNLILQGQTRLITLSGDGLTLRAVGTFTSRLEWRRAGIVNAARDL